MAAAVSKSSPPAAASSAGTITDGVTRPNVAEYRSFRAVLGSQTVTMKRTTHDENTNE